jgi:hypothetical protein
MRAFAVLVLAAGALAAGAAAAPPTIPSCGTLVAAPRSIALVCGDANYGLVGLTWSHWGAAAATGTGSARANDCRPRCASGHFHTYPVRATAGRLQTCKGGRREYTLLLLHYGARRPPGVGVTDVWDLTCAAP